MLKLNKVEINSFLPQFSDIFTQIYKPYIFSESSWQPLSTRVEKCQFFYRDQICQTKFTPKKCVWIATNIMLRLNEFEINSFLPNFQIFVHKYTCHISAIHGPGHWPLTHQTHPLKTHSAWSFLNFMTLYIIQTIYFLITIFTRIPRLTRFTRITRFIRTTRITTFSKITRFTKFPRFTRLTRIITKFTRFTKITHFTKFIKISQAGNCSDNPKTVRIIQKLSRKSKNCINNLKNSPDNPKTVLTIQKLSGQSRNCPDNLETIWIIYIETVQTRGEQIVFWWLNTNIIRLSTSSQAPSYTSPKIRLAHWLTDGAKNWPNTNTNTIRIFENDWIWIPILFRFSKLTKYEYYLTFQKWLNMNTIKIFQNYRVRIWMGIQIQIKIQIQI